MLITPARSFNQRQELRSMVAASPIFSTEIRVRERLRRGRPARLQGPT